MMENTKTVSYSCGFSVVKWFVFSAGALLIFTGFAKIWSAFGSAELLVVKESSCRHPVSGFIDCRRCAGNSNWLHLFLQQEQMAGRVFYCVSCHKLVDLSLQSLVYKLV